MTTNPTKKWTPGKWKVHGPATAAGQCGVYIGDNPHIASRRIAKLGSPRTYDSPLNSEDMANAHLIAAAPRMYDMLEDILGFLQRSGYDTKLVKSVMAEARGETP